MKPFTKEPTPHDAIPGLVPARLFHSATVIQSNVRNLASVSGPVLMGLAARYAGIDAGYGLAAMFLTVAVLLSARVRLERMRP